MPKRKKDVQATRDAVAKAKKCAKDKDGNEEIDIRFVSYQTGAKMFGLGLSSFRTLAIEAGACFGNGLGGRRVLVDPNKVEAYVRKNPIEQ